MNRVLVTMAPAIEAFTSMYSPARRAASAMTSSVRLPSVAFSRPPAASPVLAATDSVAWLRSAASGTMAITDRTNSSVCDSGASDWPASTAGTKTSSQRSLLCRTSCSRGCFIRGRSRQGLNHSHCQATAMVRKSVPVRTATPEL